jgi:nicotinamidase/pyrazinamidase
VRDEQRDVVVQKGTHRATDSYSGFGDASATKRFEQTHLQAALNAAGATDVVVLGLATDFCVSFTCKDAAACGFRTWCVLDGSRHIAADSLAAEIAAMRAAGCHIVTSADVAEIVAAPTSEAAVELAQRLDARDGAAVSK